MNWENVLLALIAMIPAILAYLKTLDIQQDTAETKAVVAEVKTQTDGMATKLGDAKFAEGVKATQEQLIIDQATEAKMIAVVSAAVSAALAKQAVAPLVQPNGDPAIPVVPAPVTVVPPPTT